MQRHPACRQSPRLSSEVAKQIPVAADWERLFHAAEQFAAEDLGKGRMTQMGTTGTILLKASRARRKFHVSNVMRLAQETVCAGPGDRLSQFVTKKFRAGFRLQQHRGCSYH